MPRAIWTGAVSFGLVNVPVQLHTAVRDLDVHFHLLEERSKARIEVRRCCSKEEVEVPWEEVAHGWDDEDGGCVMVTDAELQGLEPRRTRTIDIEAFVDLCDIDPIHFDHPYFLVPAGGEGAARAYRLLAEVMERSGRVAIGRFVLRTKEHLVALRVRDGAVALSTMLFADEIRAPDELGKARPGKSIKPKPRAVKEMQAVIEELSTDFESEAYEDRHRKRLETVIARKRKKQEIEIPDAPETPTPAPDLMAALKATLEAARAGDVERAGRFSRDGEDDADGAEGNGKPKASGKGKRGAKSANGSSRSG